VKSWRNLQAKSVYPEENNLEDKNVPFYKKEVKKFLLFPK